MHAFLTGLAALTVLVYLKAAVDVWMGRRRISRLEDIAPIDATAAPSVSVVIPACNEEAKIEQALRSVLAQDYPRLEAIVVDDRSTDSTGAILDRIAATHPALRPVHIATLPPGWLGKNHALHTGASQAGGEWILFADADVVMDRTAVARALRYATEHEVDHLAVAPRAVVPGFLSNVFLAGFALMFSMHTRPWLVRDPNAREHIGIGAFNLVRASAYRAMGGHTRIALRPDDDLKLGKLVKISGYRSDFVIGAALLCVPWYGSWGELRHGLMKNFFSAFNYSVAFVVGASVAQMVLFVWPPIGALVLHGWASYLNAAAVVFSWIAFASNAPIVRMKPWWGLTLPLASVLASYLSLRSMILNLRHRGIEWRGTRYPLDELRANKL